VDRGSLRPRHPPARLPADQWAEEWIAERLRDIGLDDVRLEPITVTRWEPTDWTLEVTDAGGTTTTIECFPVPFSAPVDRLDVDLAAYDESRPAVVSGKASLYDVPLLTIPADLLATAGSALAAPIDDPGARCLRYAAADRRRVLPPGGGAGDELPHRALLPVRRDGHARQGRPGQSQSLTRATIRIVDSTAGVSAAELRAGVVTATDSD
jgi:hypothetical protein